MAMPLEPAGAWGELVGQARTRVAQALPLETRGTLTRLTGLVLEAAGLRVPVGAQCQVQMAGQAPVLAEVVGFAGDKAFLMPAGDIHGLSSGARVTPAASHMPAPVLGRKATEPVDNSAGVLHLPI